jgi:hypothetical protein
MQAPVYDAAPTPAILLYALLAAVLVTLLILFIKRPKSGSTLSFILYISLALLIGVGVGWYGRVYLEHYKFTHQTYIDCPNC